MPFGIHGWLGSAYSFTSRPERLVEWYRAELARGRDIHASTRACMVIGLAGVMGSPDEALAATTGLIDAAEATGNPYAISFALLAYGHALRHTDPHRARESMRRGLVIAQDSGTRAIETHLAGSLTLLEANSGEPLAALEYFALAIRRYHDAGNTASMRPTLAALAGCLDRLGHHEPAATIAGFAFDPVTAAWMPDIDITIAHLRDVLGDENYESLAREGEGMTTAAMVTYALDQIDQARAELNAVSK